ncbi:polysaccharide deacetylase family protein [Pseudobacillus wudalianchiensis]|uniref:NodB homology domain-containing protein n=1 Tax=Pseudobacillus wudalianchiensis TaxID=1743143 RepID=A0A1B9AAR8_9BACI|nr:polysaccharide deacetylase family protein [Bacillus wudalianchiensis]OCA80942.1 hypothetical protein A8F95_17730 [Bacillus wudalianchiensis]
MITLLITAALILLFLFIYTVGATVFIRIFGIGIYKRGTRENMIALTFDDGPHPLYTPQLLDLLEKHKAKATFFIVGSKARTYPHIVQDIRKRGHSIGIHNDIHRSNWLFSPFVFKKQLRRAQSTITNITGEPPFYYRPPWGHFNALTLYAVKPLQTIMWTAIPGDWKESVHPEELANRLRKERKNGAIITLHDSGTTLGADERAPANTLKALELFLADEDSANYHFVNIHTMLHQPEKSEV